MKESLKMIAGDLKIDVVEMAYKTNKSITYVKKYLAEVYQGFNPIFKIC